MRSAELGRDAELRSPGDLDPAEEGAGGEGQGVSAAAQHQQSGVSRLIKHEKLG